MNKKVTNLYSDGKSRRRLANYLRLDSCKQLVGQSSVSSTVNFRRYMLFIIAAVIIIIGLIYIIF